MKVAFVVDFACVVCVLSFGENKQGTVKSLQSDDRSWWGPSGVITMVHPTMKNIIGLSPKTTEASKKEVMKACNITQVTSSTSKTKRLALALRGGAFRAGFSKKQDRCSNASYVVQRAVVHSIQKHVIRAFIKKGWKVDVYVMAFPCTVKRNAHYMNDLKDWFKPHVKVFDIFDPAVDLPSAPKLSYVSYANTQNHININ